MPVCLFALRESIPDEMQQSAAKCSIGDTFMGRINSEGFVFAARIAADFTAKDACYVYIYATRYIYIYIYAHGGNIVVERTSS